MAERNGFIWLFFGNSSLPEEERAPIPSATHQDAAGQWQQPLYGEVELDVGHFAAFENASDMSHM